MRRTCSGVIAVLVDGALGGVVGRSMPAMVVDFVLMDQAVESIVYSQDGMVHVCKQSVWRLPT